MFPAWKQCRFDTLYKTVSEKNDLSYDVECIISVANMYFKPDARISDPEYLRTYNIFKYGDIAFEGNKSKSYANGRFVENTIGDGIVSHVFNVLRPLSPKHNLEYWKYAINNENVMGRILARCTKKTTMMTNLVTADFLEQEICCPIEPEQDKIALFLSLIEKRIAAQEQFVEHLKKYKRGVLRTIFNSQKAHAWKRVKLKEVTSIYDGTHQTPEYQPYGIKFVSVENIQDLQGTKKYISAEAFQKEFRIYPEIGDVLMTRIGDIGRATYINFDETIAFYVSLALFKCGPLVKGEYLQHYICTDKFQKELWERTLHIAFPKKINTGEIGECSISLPTIDEQIKVAAVGSAIDKRIRLAENELSLFHHLKSGLLQQLFI